MRIPFNVYDIILYKKFFKYKRNENKNIFSCFVNRLKVLAHLNIGRLIGFEGIQLVLRTIWAWTRTCIIRIFAISWSSKPKELILAIFRSLYRHSCNWSFYYVFGQLTFKTFSPKSKTDLCLVLYSCLMQKSGKWIYTSFNCLGSRHSIARNQFQNCFERWTRHWQRCTASQRD